MTNLELFLKSNKITKPNQKFAPTKSLCDKDGNPVEWEFRHVSTKESDAIRQECTKSVPTGKYGQYTQKFDGDKYMELMIVKATVNPDLYNKELQDAYGVKTPNDLLKEMIDDPKEYNALVAFVGGVNEESDINDKVKEVKN